ncbi:hypothetical protein ACFWGN_20855 [Oerskovia sp. NPDC060338]|uniref:hypothetical protein n=1 Tax=Oerskovia sp. NPDC060338 TaxID=3347100 RepID=UPI00365F1155
MATIEETQAALREAIEKVAVRAADRTTVAALTAEAEAAKNLAMAHRLLSKEPVEYDVADSVF